MIKRISDTLKNIYQNSKVLRIVRNKYFLVTTFFIVWILFIDTNNLFVWWDEYKQVQEQEQQKEYYKEAIKWTDERLKELSSNTDSLEKFAREQYLFHNPDEEVFIIKEE
ncbi:MAG: septum formation inhibitor [Bacteroidales bacterium]|jgi:cell division protein FtsB|nr:septum formation inhibitor [Bacteroidales bacterium]MBQ1930103.1 septum formation inhibitor [Bacteroidales bacterium]MBQ5784279.1 septum formation inhibitor [Bacteroidales bacterium]MBQ5864830.1 septum formation inhibitor [Bacteroidales bacterium]MBR6541131.1 septum formation inhibitor [Bacteroidales bacterium]